VQSPNHRKLMKAESSRLIPRQIFYNTYNFLFSKGEGSIM